MPPKLKRKSNNGRVYTTVSTPKQIHFPPLNRTVSALRDSRPSSSTRQQTLTQIDFVTKTSPLDDDISMDFEEVESPPARKRKKTFHEMPPTNRVIRARTVESPSAGIVRRDSSEQDSTKSTVKLEAPKTPHKPRVLEVPSSQSPPDTPFSSKSTRCIRSPTRSPLKDKSMNSPTLFRHPLRSNVKSPWHPKLEVKSTLPWEREESDMSTLSSKSNNTESCGKESFPSQKQLTPSGKGRHNHEIILLKMVNEVEQPSHGVPIRGSPPSRHPKSQIKDSDDEEDENDSLGRSQELPFTRANEDELEHDPPSSPVQAVPTSIPVEEFQTTEFDPGQDTQHLLDSADLSSSMPLPEESPPIYPFNTSAAPCNTPPAHPNSAIRASRPSQDQQPSSPPPLLRSESEELTAQLQSDMFQYTQLQPWQDTLGSPIHTTTSLDQLSSSQHKSYKSASSRILPSTHASQATTVDITQPSRQPPQIDSSPPPTSSSYIPPPSLTTQTQMTWTGKVEGLREGAAGHETLTMSQLLPESLMRDSLPLPPTWSQESFDEG